MVGWAGAPQGAPVACNAGSSNPVQSTTMVEPLVVGFKLSVTGGCLYGYDPHSDTPLLAVPSMLPQILPYWQTTVKNFAET